MRALLFFLEICAWAQSGIEVPAIGMIVDSSGALRQVQGVAGSFLLGPASMSGVLSAACSEQLCLVKTDATILSATGQTDAPQGPAIFGFSGDSAIVFFPEPHVLARWHDNVLEPLDWIVDGEVLSVQPDEIAIRRGGETLILHPDGSVADSLPEARGPVLLLSKGVVFATRDEIILRLDNSEVRFELSDAQSITAMGLNYAVIHTSDAVYALRTDSGREALYRLPGSAP